MSPKTINSSVFVLVVAGILSSAALASDLETSFEPPDNSLVDFTLGTSPNSVMFAGGEAKIVGIVSLYRTGSYSWMIDEGNTGTITFETPASSVDLWFRDQTSAVNSVLIVFDDTDAIIQTFNGTETGFASVSITRDPATQTPIGRITLQNNGGTGNGYAVIDDFSFCAFVAAGCTTDADCGDGNACNGVESCAGGTCASGTAPDCNDSNACTDDSCNASTGCVNTADATNTCSDGDACTENDACVAGTCVGTDIAGCSSTPPVDTDGDGTPDESDGCPNDPEKVERGNCGCGTPDFDPEDGTPNCSTEAPPGAAPAVTMTASPLSGSSPLTVTFNGNAQTEFGIDLTATEWDFGDGQRSFGATAVTHTYSAPPGETFSFTARLMMTDVDGRTGFAEAEIRVLGESAADLGDASGVGGVAIVITEAGTIDTAVSEGISPLDVVLAITTDTLEGATINTVTWDLGDGSFASSFSVMHQYVVEGAGPQTFVIVATVQLQSAVGTPFTRFADRFLTVHPGVPTTDAPDPGLPGTTPLGDGGPAAFLCGTLGMIPLMATLAGMSLLRGTRRRRFMG